MDGSDLSTRVRVMLTKTSEADAILELLRASGPADLEILDKRTFWQLEATGRIEIDSDELSDYVGRTMSVEDIQVCFATYAGRVLVEDGIVSVTTDFVGLD